MPNRVLVSEADVAYLVTQLQNYADAAVAESQQTAVMRSGNKWKDLVDEINHLCGTSMGYDADVDDFVDALQTTFPDPTTGLPSGYVSMEGITTVNGAPGNSNDTVLKLLCDRSGIVTIDDVDGNITTIPSYKFYNCSGLISVDLPTCTTVEEYAFNGCTSLENINLSNATTIGGYVFAGAARLTSLYLPKLTTITGQRCFSGCTSLITLDLPKVESGLEGFIVERCTNLRAWNMPAFHRALPISAFSTITYGAVNLNVFTAGISTIAGMFMNGASSNPCTNIYLLRATGKANYNVDIRNYNPTVAYSTSSNNLVAQQPWDLDDNGDLIDCSGFTYNSDKALYCFKNFFMPAFDDVTGTGATLTLKSTVYDVVMADSGVTSYFSTNGWTVARIA